MYLAAFVFIILCVIAVAAVTRDKDRAVIGLVMVFGYSILAWFFFMVILPVLFAI